MKLSLMELTDKNEICKTYDIYKVCMFMPTKEKFLKKVDAFLNDCTIKIFACLYKGKIKGVAVISFKKEQKAEIIGIAVAEAYRHQGIGSYMINKFITDYGLLYIYVETDKDAVDFYHKNNFKITEFLEDFDGEAVTRYKCELKNIKRG